jgi:hypothetical protein
MARIEMVQWPQNHLRRPASAGVTRSMEKHVEDSLKKAAGPGVRMKKTREGYSFEGSLEQIEHMKKQLR